MIEIDFIRGGIKERVRKEILTTIDKMILALYR
jgi:hypothetical protein